MFKAGEQVEYQQSDGTWHPAKIVATWEDRDRYTLDDGDNLKFDVRSRFLRHATSDESQSATSPVQYPPLRVMLTVSQPTLTWQQVLNTYPLAASQPHLFLRGKYETVNLLNMQLLDTPYIRISNNADADDYFLVFVIDEE
jgi:hypothetical protein